jgi:Fe-S cluster biogenesis protein NfuA
MVASEKKKLLERVDDALEVIRPHLAVDGGNVEVIDITDDMIVKIKWLGNCKLCEMSAMTLKAGLEDSVRTKVPEIESVEAINGV